MVLDALASPPTLFDESLSGDELALTELFALICLLQRQLNSLVVGSRDLRS
jgi:hypothetical protein